MIYRTIWFLEVALVLVFLFILTVPVQDYALREFKEYWRHQSPETLQAFRDKTKEESRLRRTVAIPIAAGALALAIPIFRIRQRRTKT
jgi:hypothetical protein